MNEKEKTVEAHDVKEYLLQIKYVNQTVGTLKRELDATKITFVRAATIKDDKVQETNAGQYDNKYMGLFDLSEQINDEIDILIDYYQIIRKQILHIKRKDELCYLILHERYLNNLSWDVIADHLHQSLRQVHRLHGQALMLFRDEFYEILWTYKFCH